MSLWLPDFHDSQVCLQYADPKLGSRDKQQHPRVQLEPAQPASLIGGVIWWLVVCKKLVGFR